MNTRTGKPGVGWWEYPASALVSLFLLLIGGLLTLLSTVLWILNSMRKHKLIPAIVLLVIIAVACWTAWSYYGTVDLGQRVVTIIVNPGDTFGGVVDRLLAEGVVRSRTLMSWPARLRGIDKKLTPGRYDFTGKNSCRSVLGRLQAGDFLRIKVTIPEGAPIWRVASILADRLELDSAGVVALNSDSAFLSRLQKPTLEGYLFPETYRFAWGISTDDALRAMVMRYHSLTDSVWPDTIPDGLSRSDIITLASIIEAETRLDSERVLVASVYMNRLRRNMKLDADPTVIYGLGGLDRPLYRKDLRKDTPYNTYLHRGLPPGPINSPGLKAIRAALNPAETGYYYFVADETGGHRFSRTNAEHNRARREIKARKP